MHPSVVANFVPIDGGGRTTDVRLSSERAMITSALCYAAISYRARKVAEAPLYVADEKVDGEPWVKSHLLARLLGSPNADQDMSDLLEETHQYLDLDGRALWLIDQDRLGRPAVARAYAAHEFSVKPANGRLYGEFRISTSAGPVTVGPERVVFFKYLHPNDRWDGLSPTDVVLAWLGIESQMRESIKAGLRNAVVPGMVISHPEGHVLSPDQRKEYKASLREGYASSYNHGRPFLTEGGATVTLAKLGFAGLEGGNLYREIEAIVCLVFGTRPEILGALVGLENSPWSHMKTAQQLSYDETIIPLQERYARALTRQLLQPIDATPGRKVMFDRSRIRALEPDRERDARRSVLLRDVATLNQRRQVAGLEPMTGAPEVWDAPPRVPAPLTPEPAPPKRGPAIETKASAASRFGKLVRRAEPVWRTAATAQLTADRDAILALAASVLRVRKDDDGFAAADEASVRELGRQADQYIRGRAARGWERRARTLITEHARAAGQQLATDVGVSFGLLQPGVVDFARRESAWLVDEITATTREGVADALATAMEEGESVAQISKRIRESGTFGRSRADLIARTEAARVANGAQHESMRDYAVSNDQSVAKTWLTAGDADVRDEHVDMEGETVGIGEEFSNGLDYPSEPNCRCTLTYAIED